MKSAKTHKFIGFPSGLLTNSPLRMSVLSETDDWFAVDRPAGIPIRQHPWNLGISDMDSALNRQIQAKKPELLRSGATMFGSIFYIEPEISGVALFAKNRNSLAKLRNCFGSEQFKFKFVLVAKTADINEFTINAPLLPHNTKPKMIPSTAKGKKAQTAFKRLDESPLGFAIWEACTAFPRPHQVRAHAAIQKIAPMGDILYSGATSPLLSEITQKKRVIKAQRPLFDHIPLHLSEVAFSLNGDRTETILIVADLPKDFKLLMKRLKLNHPK